MSGLLAEQAQRSGLEDRFEMLPATPNLGDVYATADAFFLSSRLDPLPNVAIDASCEGLPVICFEKPSGFAELLSSNLATRPLVVPYMDVCSAAQQICRLATDPAGYAAGRDAMLEFARETFSMDAYVEKLHAIGVAAAAAVRKDSSA